MQPELNLAAAENRRHGYWWELLVMDADVSKDIDRCSVGSGGKSKCYERQADSDAKGFQRLGPHLKTSALVTINDTEIRIPRKQAALDGENGRIPPSNKRAAQLIAKS